MSERETTWDDLPNVRTVGRYLFVAACAVGLNLIAYGVFYSIGVPKIVAQVIGNGALVAGFMALRDMSKSWDLHLQSVAHRRAAASDEERP